jgi:hypothetical protein
LPTTPEDLEQLEIEDGVERLEEPHERPSVSAVQPVTGSRSRRPPPPPPRRRSSYPDALFSGDDRSSISPPGASTSQVANLVVPQQPSRPPTSPLALKIGAAAACVAGGVLAFLLLGPGHYETFSGSSVVAGGAPPKPPGASPVPAAVEPKPVPEPAKELPRSPSAEVSPAESPSSVPKGTLKRGAQKPAARPESSAPPVDCNPPFTVDSNGIRRPKAGCL